MTQEAIEISTTPPLPGLKLVQDVNKALQTIATDFAGPTDPAGLPGCGPYCKWADTANGLLKRRNAANTAWVVEGKLFVDSTAPATQWSRGIIRIATYEEAQAMVDNEVALTPWRLGEVTATETRRGIIEIATTAEAQAFTDDQRAITPKKLGDAMNARVPGMGQTWQDVTPQRAIHTVYTNTTGRPILVSVCIRIPPGGGNIRLVIQGMDMAGYDSGSDPGWAGRPFFTVCGLVPSGSSYAVSSNSSDVLYWRELR